MQMTTPTMTMTTPFLSEKGNRLLQQPPAAYPQHRGLLRQLPLQNPRQPHRKHLPLPPLPLPLQPHRQLQTAQDSLIAGVVCPLLTMQTGLR